MRVLRSEWSKRMTGALERLKAGAHPFCKVVYNLVSGRAKFRGKGVTLLPIAKIEKNHFYDYVESYNKSNKEKLSYAYPPTEKTLSVLRKDMQGVVYGSNVYISEKLRDPNMIAVVLIHELTHFIRSGIESYDNKASIFREELAAHYAEHLVWSKKRITRSKLHRIAQKISNLYEVPMPKKISLPDLEILDKASKELVLKR